MAQTYRAPGIYTVETQTQEFAQLPPGFRTPAIVGTGNTTEVVLNTAVVKGATNGTDLIVSTLVDTVSSIVQIGSVPSLAEFLSYAQSDNSVDWSGATSQPVTGSTYYVTYRHPKASIAYAPTTYFSMADIRAAYGDEIVNGVLSPITAAANLLFANGAPLVVIAQAASANNSDIQAAIDTLKAIDVDVVIVPEATNSTLQNYLRSHCLTESSQSVRHERVMITGFVDGLSPSVNSQISAAQALAEEKVWVVTPPAVNITFKDTATQTDKTLLLPSSYAAAAWGGLVCNPAYKSSEPYTRRTLVGIDNLSTFNYLPTQMDLLAGNGNITVLTNEGGAIKIRQAVTTNSATIPQLVPSIIIAKFQFVKRLRRSLDAQFIGTVIDNSTASAVTSAIKAFCDTMVNDRELRDYDRNIKVKQDANDPRKMNVTMRIAPLFPFEYCDVTFSLFSPS